MQCKRKSKGITLVSLVITIVLMLILASVSISAILNNDGLFSRTTLSTREYKKENIIEIVKMAEIQLDLDRSKDETIERNISNLIKIVKETSEIKNENYIVTVDDVEQTATIIDKKMKVVVDVQIDEEGKIIIDGNLVDDINDVMKPTVEYTLFPEEGTYAEEVIITIIAREENSGIQKIKFPDGTEKTYNNEKEVTETYTVTENGTYKFVVQGSNERITNTYVEVKNTMNASDIIIEAQNSNPTNQAVNVLIKYDENVKDDLIAEIKKQIIKQFGENPLVNKTYGKIINEKHFNRVKDLIDENKVIVGGKYDENTLKIEPTVMDNVSWDDLIMQEEIFGPILPILTFKSADYIIEKIENRPHPLALYVFSQDKKFIDKITSHCRFGGGCINDVVVHLATPEMPFGGFGESGMGAYHGKFGFETFSHRRSILDKSLCVDLPMRYQPYKTSYFKLLKLFLK